MQRLLPKELRAEYDARLLERIDRIAAENEALQALMRTWLNGLRNADPNVKFWQEVLDPAVPVVVRYEGRSRYAIYTTETSGTPVSVQLVGGASFELLTSAPGWIGLDYPAGSRLLSGDSDQHVILVRASNINV